MEVGCRMEPRTKRQQCVWRSRDYELGKMGVFVSYCYCTSCRTHSFKQHKFILQFGGQMCEIGTKITVLEGLCSFWEP